MARITPVLGHQLLIKIGDGADPEVFAHPNLINASRGIEFSADTEAGELVDLADQSAPAATTAYVKSTSFTVSGDGRMSAADTQAWIEWLKSGEAKNVRLTDGEWIIPAAVKLTSFKVSADRSAEATNELTLVSHGDWSIESV